MKCWGARGEQGRYRNLCNYRAQNTNKNALIFHQPNTAPWRLEAEYVTFEEINGKCAWLSQEPWNLFFFFFLTIAVQFRCRTSHPFKCATPWFLVCSELCNHQHHQF